MRTCGDCTACCIAPSIPELAKPARERCIHLGGSLRTEGPTGLTVLVEVTPGCSIYDWRPPVCKSFVCAWLAEHPALTGSQRPDKLGVLAYVQRDLSNAKRWIVMECKAGALEKEAVKLLIRELGEQYPVSPVRWPA